MSRWRVGCAIVVQQYYRRFLVDCLMGALTVAVLAPILRLFLRIRKGREQVHIQVFGPAAPVEHLDERVVCRLPGPGEGERNAALISPKDPNRERHAPCFGRREWLPGSRLLDRPFPAPPRRRRRGM